MHPIALYLAESGKTVDEYASAAKSSENAIYKYLQGTRKPRIQRLKQLSKATGGKVTVKDLLSYYDNFSGAESTC